jgi:hypothetical protein
MNEFEAEARQSDIYQFSPYRKQTQHFSITKINLLMFYKEVIPVYTENHMKPVYAKILIYWLLKQAAHIFTTGL